MADPGAQNGFAALLTRDRHQKQQIAIQETEIARLKAALQILISPNNVATTNIDNNANRVDGSREPVWDDDDCIFRCCRCAWEVVEGVCQMCETQFDWDQTQPDHLVHGSVSTHTEALNADRSLIPRGTTPLLNISHNNPPPLEYLEPGQQQGERLAEYYALLQRGATRLMCETFHLEFTPEKGIVAWADSEIYENFSGPGMKPGDFWKIHLGRRVELDAEDLDGSLFLEGLLEDALLFPLRSEWSNRVKERWETIQETPGIWVTRIMQSEKADADEESSERGYESFEEDARYPHFLGPTEESFKLDEVIDEALERQQVNKTSPVVTDDHYEGSGTDEDAASDASDVNMDREGDPGWTWEAGVPDGVWTEGISEDDDTDMDAESEYENSDSIDSDFDPDDGVP